MFAQRAIEPEIMDEPAAFSAADAAASFRFIELVNRWLGGRAAALSFVRARAPATGAFSLLDVGSGSGDIARALDREARRRGHDWRITCLERCPHAVATARGRLGPGIEIVQGDVLTWEPPAPVDVVLMSMFCHHFSDTELVGLLRRLWPWARRGMLINDLRRGFWPWFGCALLALPSPAVVRHDACLSVRRGFRVGELRDLLTDALPEARIAVRRHWCGRVVASIDHEDAP